jgi:sulfate adenylyltransferase subunit 1 (EFTu-like GTPase family)
VVEPSERLPWWQGPTLLEHLEGIELAGDRDASHRRFPVQWVIRPMSGDHHDYRGYAGQVAGGEWRAGDEVVVLPSGLRTRVAAVETVDGPLEQAVQGMSVVVRLEDDLDVPRGEMLADPADQPVTARELEATVCWMSERPAAVGARLGIKHTTRWSRAVLDAVESKLDMESLAHLPGDGLELNDIARVRLRLAGPLLVDPYTVNRTTGAFVLVDEATNDTVAAGMVVAAHP